MINPRVTRPRFPEGYVRNPTRLVSWGQVVESLSLARNYWLCSVRPNGRPHAIPVWGAWLDGRFYFDGSPETRHARNVSVNPRVVLHLESGEAVVIVEGEVHPAGKLLPELARKIARAYSAKYASLGYAPDPGQWDAGGLFELTPDTVLAWTKFDEDPTKFVLG